MIYPLDVVISISGASSGPFIVQLHVALVQRVAVHLNCLERVARGVRELLPRIRGSVNTNWSRSRHYPNPPVTHHNITGTDARNEQKEVQESVW